MNKDERNLAVIGLTLKNGIKLLSMVPMEELEVEEGLKKYTLINPCEYLFLYDEEGVLRASCVPYVLGFSDTEVNLGADQIESTNLVDKDTLNFYVSNARSAYKPKVKKDVKKDVDNIYTFH